MRTRIKICGITRTEDALHAAQLGADAIGLVFHDDSPRLVERAQASAIVAGLPPFVAVVALFVDAEPERIRSVIGALRVDLLQFHGTEPPEACRIYGRPYIKALRMRAGIDLPAQAARYGDAAALLLDAYRPGRPGGTGETFDWGAIAPGLGRPLILAGGLRPDNVAGAVQAVRPYAVDVSSGVERSGGIKDTTKMAAFCAAVRRGDAQVYGLEEA